MPLALENMEEFKPPSVPFNYKPELPRSLISVLRTLQNFLIKVHRESLCNMQHARTGLLGEVGARFKTVESESGARFC